MKGDDLLKNFYEAINATMRPKKRKKIITNVFNWKTKANRENIYKDTYGKYVEIS